MVSRNDPFGAPPTTFLVLTLNGRSNTDGRVSLRCAVEFDLQNAFRKNGWNTARKICLSGSFFSQVPSYRDHLCYLFHRNSPILAASEFSILKIPKGTNQWGGMTSLIPKIDASLANKSTNPLYYTISVNPIHERILFISP
jgi:hypothetical protein